MKKFIVAILTLVMLLSIAAVVSAEAKSFTIYNVPCEAIADSELYGFLQNGHRLCDVCFQACFARTLFSF